MRLLVTGSNGFIGKNLVVQLNELQKYQIDHFNRGDDITLLQNKVSEVDAVIHLAGENRPDDVADFDKGNAQLTSLLCEAVRNTGRKIALILASSSQADSLDHYGVSKRKAEIAVEKLSAEAQIPSAIFRLPGVFGKWCRPNYNSVVATFCHNIANNLPIAISDPDISIRLVYIDDVVTSIINQLELNGEVSIQPTVQPEFSITLGELAVQIQAFKNCRENLISERVGTGLTRALYATYVSYLPTAQFSYEIPCHGDERGVFVEMLKTMDSGQFSFFTAHPGVTRGQHYHNSKTEKFLVIRGKARFNFRHLLTDEIIEVCTTGESPRIVDTIPGWVHDITNIGDSEMLVLLWANEIFDREFPDTFHRNV
jgi:UDP-2-acetamido-2,6-beta-L-arabino-hexul-4-ose reductase